MIIFPEGTRNTCGSLLPFKHGAFKLAALTGVKIQPVIVQRYNFINHEQKVFGHGELKIRILPALMLQANETVEEFSQRSYQLMDSEFKKMNN